MTQGAILPQPLRSIKWEETLPSGVQLSSSKGDGRGLGYTCTIMTSNAGGTLPCGSEQPSESLTPMELAGNAQTVAKPQSVLSLCWFQCTLS